MRYEETIRNLYQRSPNGYGWRDYDERFRFQRQSTLCPWDQIDHELWLQSITFGTSSYNMGPQNSYNPQNSHTASPNGNNAASNSFRNQSYRYDSNKRPNGKFNEAFQVCKAKQICFRYQNGSCGSNSCKFKHVCYICSGSHMGTKCAQKDTNGGKAKPSNSG